MNDTHTAGVSALWYPPVVAQEMQIVPVRRAQDFDRTTPMSTRAGPNSECDAVFWRRWNLAKQVAALKEQGRMASVCPYALTVNAEALQRTLGEARAFAICESWQDDAERAYVDRSGPTDRTTRMGWPRGQQQVRSGFVDSDVGLTQGAIAPHPDDYEAQLQGFEKHFGCTAPVDPEFPVMQR